MAYRFRLTHVFPVSPKVLYDTWLSSQGHTALTGGKAKMSASLGGRYTAWDGYISGRNLALEPGRRIVQSWRTAEFADADKDSKITVTLTPVKAGTRLTLAHSGVPDCHTSYQRACMNGDINYLSQRIPSPGYPQYPNGTTDEMLWGCIGDWFSGDWYDDGAVEYIAKVKPLLAGRV